MHADFSKCTYRNVEYILKEQGGRDSEAARKATANLVKRCLQMGEPWFKVHPLTERVELVNLEQGWSDTLEKSWSQHVNQPEGESCAAKQSEPEMTPTAKKRNSPEETPKVKAKAKAKTKGLVESIDAELNKKLVAASKVKTCYHQTCSKADWLLAEMSSNSSLSWASAFGEELESKRAALRIADPLVDTFLLSELSARDWAKRAISGAGGCSGVAWR